MSGLLDAQPGIMTIHFHPCKHTGHGRFNPANGDGEQDIKGGCPYCHWLLKVWQTVQAMAREERTAA